MFDHLLNDDQRRLRDEIMAMITAHEWYRESERLRATEMLRDPELDAAESGAEGEKVYE